MGLSVSPSGGAFNGIVPANLDLPGDITPPALTADVNNYAPTGFSSCSVIRLATDNLGDWVITGLAGGTDGKLILIHNIDTNARNILFSVEDTNSSAANRFLNDGYNPIPIAPNTVGLLQYDATVQRWRALFTPPAPVPGDNGLNVWGNFSGTLSDQADLQTVLDAKLALAGGTMTGQLVLRTGGTGAGTGPLKFVSGSLMTSPIAGVIEFLTDVLYFTKTTGATRTSIATCPSAGPITFAGPTAARIITVPNAASTMARTDAAQSFTGDQTFGAKIIGGAAIRLKGFTVATLPAGTQGDTAFVTDALAPAFLAIIVGGGAVITPVFFNGTNWVGY